MENNEIHEQEWNDLWMNGIEGKESKESKQAVAKQIERFVKWSECAVEGWSPAITENKDS